MWQTFLDVNMSGNDSGVYRYQELIVATIFRSFCLAGSVVFGILMMTIYYQRR